MTTFTLPDLGEGLQDAEVVAWHVNAGDHVVADQPLVSVETDKAVVEVPSPHAGRIERLCAKVGDRVKVGAPLVQFEEGTHADTGAVVGELRPAPAAPTKAPPPAAKAVPAARKRAHELGIDLAAVKPTGPDGTITVHDVEAATAGSANLEGEPLRGMRHAMAMNMARSGAEIVPATVTDDADIDAWTQPRPVTERLVRAIMAGCAAAPALNAWYDSRTMRRRLHPQVDLGIAVETDDGLIVPVLRDAARRSPAEIRAALEALKSAARNRTIAPADLKGATITLSNFGMLAGRHGALTIMPPQVAILGVGRAQPEVVAIDNRPAIRRRLPLSLTFDHRVVTGGEAARFLRAVIDDLEKPA